MTSLSFLLIIIGCEELIYYRLFLKSTSSCIPGGLRPDLLLLLNPKLLLLLLSLNVHEASVLNILTEFPKDKRHELCLKLLAY